MKLHRCNFTAPSESGRCASGFQNRYERLGPRYQLAKTQCNLTKMRKLI